MVSVEPLYGPNNGHHQAVPAERLVTCVNRKIVRRKIIVQVNMSPNQAATHLWWLLLLQGIIAVIVGFLLVTWPAETTIVLVQIIGIYWLVTGLLALVSIFMDSSLWSWKLCAGILGILAGFLVIRHPIWSAVLVPFAMVLFLGIQGIIQGIVNFVHAFQGYGWGAALLGVINIILGILILSRLLIATFVLPIVLGIFAIVAGIAAIISALRIHEMQKAAAMRTQPI
jgi:uncharacterized membrane protein HdeD (DUF308 family)